MAELRAEQPEAVPEHLVRVSTRRCSDASAVHAKQHAVLMMRRITLSGASVTRVWGPQLEEP